MDNPKTTENNIDYYNQLLDNLGQINPIRIDVNNIQPFMDELEVKIKKNKDKLIKK